MDKQSFFQQMVGSPQPQVQPTPQPQQPMGTVQPVKQSFWQKLINGDKFNYTAPTTTQPKIKSPNIVAGIDISRYATDPMHEENVMKIHSSLPQFSDPTSIDLYIQKRAPKSGVHGDMILQAAQKYGVPATLLTAIMQQDSLFGTTGLGARTFNPGNVGTYGSKVTKYNSWQEGVEAVAKVLAKFKTQTH